ncbi:homeodomain-interacting protein kinase 1-like [Scomber scombrus]|uniref:homeodomain-interacting protein kinase 1-like n=1 Tax=Scomber scombrus TaxID=13677 RepID=UPI002DD9A122|nr:homeodomain-interacting protein kinase 1-like [Scomber scombrus]
MTFSEKKSSSSTSSLDSSPISDKAADKKEEPKPFEVKRHNILHSSTCRYLILDFSGEGVFGTVAKCVNLITAQHVALKIQKTQDTAEAKREIDMLEVVSVLNPIEKNIVQFFEMFELEGHTCLAFEMLDRSLYQLIKDRQRKRLSPSELRPIAHQLLTAFDALKGIGIIHSDLKPDNVMLVNHQHEPFRVKLIDFGLACGISEVKQGVKIQPVGYRAPEISLGLPITEAIDMWGLGCVLIFLFVARQPFSVHCEYEMMRNIVETIGQPADHLICAGKFSQRFFRLSWNVDHTEWLLRTPEQYQKETGIEPKVWRTPFKCLDDLTTFYPETQESIELEDQKACVDFLKCLLETDPNRRITPEEALKHPYISMAHLTDEIDTSSYVDNALEKMLVCPMDEEEAELTDIKVEIVDTSAILSSNGSHDTSSNLPGPAADVPCDQDTATTDPTKEGSAVAANTGLAPEGPDADEAEDQHDGIAGLTKKGSTADGSSEQEATMTGTIKKGSAAANSVSAPEGPASTGQAENTAADDGSPAAPKGWSQVVEAGHQLPSSGINTCFSLQTLSPTPVSSSSLPVFSPGPPPPL